MTNFSDQVPKTNQEYEFLPLFHTCDAFQARLYFKNRLIEANDVCEVFNEKITYLFYGRPAFKFAISDGGTRSLAPYPICFIFDINLLDSIKRIFPFDTGALHHKLMKNFVHNDNVVAHFNLGPSIDRIGDVVLHFYGGNQEYMDYTLRDTKLDPFDFESVAFKELHNDVERTYVDERRVTIEVQAGESLKLKGGALRAIIVPMAALDSVHLQSFINDTNVDVKTYDIDLWDPKYSFSEVAKVARTYISQTLSKS